jgi:hypothetical protein
MNGEMVYINTFRILPKYDLNCIQNGIAVIIKVLLFCAKN